MALSIITSCQNKNETEKTMPFKNDITILENVISLSGKNLEYNYGDYIYQINFKSENKLHWKCLKGDEKGEEAVETYSMQRLNNHTFFISWIEENGLSVSQVINLKDKKVNSFLKIEKDIIPLLGTIRQL